MSQALHIACALRASTLIGASTLTVRNDSTAARWRAAAKDDADLPPALNTLRLATVEMGPGQTANYEFSPTKPGVWRGEVRSVNPGWDIPLTIIVGAPKNRRWRSIAARARGAESRVKRCVVVNFICRPRAYHHHPSR